MSSLALFSSRWRALITYPLCVVDEFELDAQPLDTVSALRFSPVNPAHLLAASWDSVSILLRIIFMKIVLRARRM